MKFELSSLGSVLQVFEDRLTISQKGVVGLYMRGLSGEKTIYFRDITSIQFKETGFTSGYIKFSFPGSDDSRGIGQRAENKFVFAAQVGYGGGKELNRKATEIKQYIEERVNELSKTKLASTAPSFSVADELLKFKALLDSGVISPEEFEKKKKELLP